MRNHSHAEARRRRGASMRLAAAVSGALAVASSYAQAPDDSVPLEEVFVLGRGETRQVQAITDAQIEQLPAGTSPLKAIENLPGVNFQSADPYGAYEWSARITVRGFNQNQLGFTLDDVPLGDMTYGNHNGLHISRAIPSELVSRAELSQGTGSLDTASSSNLGGAVKFYSADPASEFGVEVAQTLGSDSARRSFGRVDSGEFGAGTRAYLAVVDGSTDKWKGGGDQDIRQYNFKIVQPIGGGKLTGYYNYSDRAEIDYQDLSLAIVERRGSDWDNWYPDWQAAVTAAQACAASGGTDTVVCDDAYWNASGLRKDDLGYLALELPFGDTVTWKTTAYLHKNEGQGLWGTPYVPTPNGAPISIRTTEYDLDRKGVISALTVKVANHEVEGGLWYETNDFTQARRYYAEPNLSAPIRNFKKFQHDPFRTDWEYDFDTETLAFHLQDTWAVTDAVRINAGFRTLDVENKAKTVVGPLKDGKIKTDKSFLPQIGVNWSFSDAYELFASVAKNAKAFPSSGTSGPFSMKAAVFEATKDDLKPETSINYEAGLRFRVNSMDLLLAAYHIDFKDRLLGIPQCVGIVGCDNVLANVGDVKTNGIEAALALRPVKSVTWFNSLSWNESKFADDYTTEDAGGVTVVPVDGKRVPDAPEILLKSELMYDNGTFFARADVNYTDKRYYTYLNDGSVDSYTLLNVGVGYRLKDLGIVDELVLQADVSNVADKEYFSTLNSNGFTAADPSGTHQSLLLGAPRQFFFSAKAKF